MATVYENRRNNLNFLIEQYSSIAKLNLALGRKRKDSALSQIRSSSFNKTNNTVRQMGSNLAREIELKLNLGYGWMDVEHENAAAIREVKNEIFDLHQDFFIPPIDTSNDLSTSLNEGIKLKESFIKKNFSNLRKEDLRVVNVDNSDMKSEIPLDSMVIIDQSVKSFIRNGVYLVGGGNFTKTFRRIVYNFNGGYEIQCDIDRPRTVTDLSAIDIRGLAVYIWRGDFL